MLKKQKGGIRGSKEKIIKGHVMLGLTQGNQLYIGCPEQIMK